MVQKVSQVPDVPPAQKRNINANIRSENGLKRVLICVGTQESPIFPFRLSSSWNSSVKKPLPARSLVQHAYQLKNYPEKQMIYLQ